MNPSPKRERARPNEGGPASLYSIPDFSSARAPAPWSPRTAHPSARRTNSPAGSASSPPAAAARAASPPHARRSPPAATWSRIVRVPRHRRHRVHQPVPRPILPGEEPPRDHPHHLYPDGLGQAIQQRQHGQREVRLPVDRRADLRHPARKRVRSRSAPNRLPHVLRETLEVDRPLRYLDPLGLDRVGHDRAVRADLPEHVRVNAAPRAPPPAAPRPLERIAPPHLRGARQARPFEQSLAVVETLRNPSPSPSICSPNASERSCVVSQSGSAMAIAPRRGLHRIVRAQSPHRCYSRPAAVQLEKGRDSRANG